MQNLEKDAETALTFLRETGQLVATLEEQSRLKTHMLKHLEGYMMLLPEYHKLAVSVRREAVRGSDRWKAAAEEEATAHAELQGLRERRDNAKITISVWQSWARDRR